MTEQVRWTPEGKAALAAVGADALRDTSDAALKKQVFATAKQLAGSWKRGVAKADAEGKAAAAFAAKTIVAGKLPRSPSTDAAARLLSLVGATGSEYIPPLGELVVRATGLPAAMEVLAKMWSHTSAYDNPDWPKSEKRAASYITVIDDDDSSVHDASCSYAKSAFTRYLHRRYASSPAAERTQMKKGVTAIWKTTVPHARPALAYATHDPKRAKQSAQELIDAGESPYPHFAWDHLPYILDDIELATRLLDDRGLSVQLIENLGTAIWEQFAERVSAHGDSHSRAEVLRLFSNFYGPKTALLIAEYEDTKECAPVVRDYFTRYPELLDKIIDEPALKYHRDDLLALTAGRLDPDRPRR
jgi:hypothetical protein